MMTSINVNISMKQNMGQEWENCLAAAMIGLLSLIGLIAYTIVIAAILKNFREFARNSYYIFVLSLAASDSIMLCIFLFYSTPATVTQSRFLGDTFDQILGVFCNLSYFAGLTCICVIAINRYNAVCRFSTYKTTFSRCNIVRILIFVWFVGLCSSIPQMTDCCQLRYWFGSYAWGYDTNSSGTRYYIWFDRSMNICTFVAVAVCYWRIFDARKTMAGRVEIGGLNNRRAKTEKRLAAQFGLVAFVLVIFGLGFTIIPELSTHRWMRWLTSILYIVNNATHPFIYLTLNSAVRQAVQTSLSLTPNDSSTSENDTQVNRKSETQSSIEMTFYSAVDLA